MVDKIFNLLKTYLVTFQLVKKKTLPLIRVVLICLFIVYITMYIIILASIILIFMDKGTLFSKFIKYVNKLLLYPVLIGLMLNSVWVILLFNGDKSLDIFFNNRVEQSALHNLTINILTFNWFYCLIILFAFALDAATLVNAELDCGYIPAFLIGWLIKFNNLGSFWYSYSYWDVKTFWLQLGAYIQSFDSENFRIYTSYFCPITIWGTITTFFKESWDNYELYKKQDLSVSFESYELYKKQDLSVSFESYATDSNNLLFLGIFLFISSSVISLLSLSHFGVYGVFMFNLATLSFFWFSLVIKLDYFLIEGNSLKINVGKWFSIWGHTLVNFELHIDSLAYGYALLTLTIALFVFAYTFSYFRYEPNVERLLLLINLFVISMLLLVSSGNFFVLFLGWELIGLTSFFLINFWSTRISTLKSAFKAMSFNKYSDVSLLIALLMTYNVYHDCNFLVINSQLHLYQNSVIHLGDYQLSYLEATSFFLLIAAFIKSAQFGTHIWLPDSMEAPVPASALIHSATLVSAGVYLVLRFSPLFELSLYAHYLLTIVGSFTAFFGGWCAIFQSDAKRILAYSTLSHCGFLMAACAVKVPELTMFYLYVHGFFKAAVFLCVGNIIRFSYNYQDFRRMGGMWKYLPFECMASLICLMNLAGLPFTLGFYIKHILFSSMAQNQVLISITMFFIVTAAVSGLIYSAKLYYYIFFDFKKGKKYMYEHTNQVSLKSILYSNTTMGANLAITGLIITGYTISIYLYTNWFSVLSISESLDLLTLESSNYYNFAWPVLIFLKSAAAINWVSLQVILILSFSVWRFTMSPHNIINIFSFISIFSIFFYISTILLS